MEEFKYIELHRTRDFGQKINATFEFVKQNFKTLGKSILFIAGPPVLIGSLMIGSFMGDFMSNIFSQAGNPDAFREFVMSWNFWAQFVLMFVFLMVSIIMSLSTINNFVWLYHQKKSNQISVQEVWDRVRGSLGMYIGSAFLLFLMFIVVYLLVILLAVGFGVASPVLAVIFGFAGVCGMAYLWIGSSLTFFIQTIEDQSFFSALLRSLKLTQGKWWSTFGLLFVLGLIGYVISYIFIIPYYIVMGVSMAHSISSQSAAVAGPAKYVTIIFFTLYYVVYLLFSSLPNVGIVFQYFNLVELKEAKGLMNEIENVGKQDENSNRPEETY